MLYKLRLTILVFQAAIFLPTWATCKDTTSTFDITYLPSTPSKPLPTFVIFSPSNSVRFDASYPEDFPVKAAVWSDGYVALRNHSIDYPAPGYDLAQISSEKYQNFLTEIKELGESYPKTQKLEKDYYYASLATSQSLGMWSLGKPTPKLSSDFLNVVSKYMKSAERKTTASFHFTEPNLRTSITENSEIRAGWINRADLLLPPAELHKMLIDLKDSGLNTLYINVQARGYRLYPLYLDRFKGLLQDSEMNRRNSAIIPWVVSEAKSMGFKVVAWGEYGMFGLWSKSENPGDDSEMTRRMQETVGQKFVGDGILFRNPELVAIDSDGNDFHYSKGFGYYRIYCPSNPKTHEELIWLYKEALTLYPFDGLNLDRIRFPSDKFCHCAYCKEHFKKDSGIELVKFEPGSENYKIWNRWRADQINLFMKKLRDMMKRDFADKELSACVAPHSLKDEKAQQWTEWLDNDYVDYVIPLLSSSQDIEADWDLLEKTIKQKDKVVLGFIPWKEINNYVDRMRLHGFKGYSMWVAKTILFYDSLFKHKINLDVNKNM